ncbi:hypothetical protein [Chamaesiphon polymorphus]|uniref:Uncharacterized protein n=1 Tax=Chamaesiphon polymorphus CCALA 037 TaxID=2107692 RepID=A0A2T1F8E5_9CYAN|nr:hypothetical protein [Chamaesiphon polymorphus]PSB41275.1 hypothetical protein C7B77_27555 [Chamaesiphon polymorphus CCALA 037]
MERYRSCPNCASEKAEAIGFTWWGGIVGPKMFNHVKCTQCGTTYNGKTGKSNQTAIAIYVGVSTVVAIAVFTVITPSRQQNNPAISSGYSDNLDRIAIARSSVDA